MLGLIAVLLVPWTLWLTFTLPTRHVTHNYRLAWVGFDIFLAVAFAATGVAALRASEWLQPLAALTGTMLLCDAWFDVVTSAGGDEQPCRAGGAPRRVAARGALRLDRPRHGALPSGGRPLGGRFAQAQHRVARNSGLRPNCPPGQQLLLPACGAVTSSQYWALASSRTFQPCCAN